MDLDVRFAARADGPQRPGSTRASRSVGLFVEGSNNDRRLHGKGECSSPGHLDKALLAQLENEGLLTVDVVPRGDGSFTKAVRFTFERYSDHAIASRLLSDHLDESDVAGSFSAGRPLHEALHGPRNIQAAGVIEAMAIQLAVQFTVRTCRQRYEARLVETLKAPFRQEC